MSLSILTHSASFQPAFSIPHPSLTSARRPRSHICPQWSSPQRHVRPPTATTACYTSPAIDQPILSALPARAFVLTGGTGLIGSAVIKKLQQHTKAKISLLSRNPTQTRSYFSATTSPITVLQYDAYVDEPLSAAARRALATADVVINLAGEPVDEGRWTSHRKQLLFQSRVCGTQKIVNALHETSSRAVFISASAVGYYGTCPSDVAFTEDAPAGSDFLARVAVAWEHAALKNCTHSRTVVFRMGVVLANGGGALQKMSAAFRAFLGGPPGGGRQWFSWVHIDDIVRLILYASVDEKWQGVYNATAPRPVRLAEFCELLGRELGRPNWLPVPSGAVRALMGSEAADLILAGQQVLPERVRKNGFVYMYKDVGSALRQLITSRKEEMSKLK